MNIVRWEPFRELDDFFRRYSPALIRGASKNGSSDSVWAPSANITETEKEYLIKAELPEVSKDDVKVTFHDGVITIAGEKKQTKEEKDEVSLRTESFYGMFSRSFELPEGIDASGIRAESKDGMLRVHVPKKPMAQRKQVEIAVQ
ncbi:MAG: Hsp20/alpha crystallin family protein [Steroidobacterales bacterium]